MFTHSIQGLYYSSDRNSNHEYQTMKFKSSTLRSNNVYKNQQLWIPSIGTICYSRALELTQSVQGMNGPDGSWNRYKYHSFPVPTESVPVPWSNSWSRYLVTRVVGSCRRYCSWEWMIWSFMVWNEMFSWNFGLGSNIILVWDENPIG